MISKNDLKVKIKTIFVSLGTCLFFIFKLFLNFINFFNIDLNVKNTDKVIDLKSKLKEKEKISEGEQNLFLDEKLLEDNTTIAENKIKESSNLNLMKSDDEIFNFAKPQEKSFIVNALQKNLGKGIRTLLYSARKDGDDANTFHKKCDRNKDLFLLSDGNTRTDSLQMVISPANNFAMKSLNNNATYHCQSGQGPHFHCMQLNTPFLSSNCTDITGCSDFSLPAYASGNSSYQIKELEVYCLKDLEH